MEYRSFGRDDVEISEIGLGCWQMGGNWGLVEESTARDILRTATNNGVNFFDTADVYGKGKSETILGKYFRGKTNDLVIATKVGRGEDIYPKNYSIESIKPRIENSLRRLRIGELDLVQTHCIPMEAMKEGTTFDCLRELQQEGKIIHFGASVETIEEANWVIEHVPGLYSVQIIFNIFRQKAIAELFENAKKHQIALIARVPLASGLLSGKMTKDSIFKKSDHRNFNKDGKTFNVGETFAGLPFEKGVELAEMLKNIKEPGLSMAQWALRWILDFDAISTVIPGATKAFHVEDNTDATYLERIPSETHAELAQFYEDNVKEHIRGAY
ncbi:MAG: aldo/keto reductase [Verrucomicrobia bacterium]|nr:aldo/keto reductase [Verrucomicrobiota bacterium]MDA1065115.1 aldo/keto reductase [Verrucomicrobiota bacterium]